MGKRKTHLAEIELVVEFHGGGEEHAENISEEFESAVDDLWPEFLDLGREVGEMVDEDGAVDLAQALLGRHLDCKGAVVCLQTRVDGERSGSWVQTGDVLQNTEISPPKKERKSEPGHSGFP